MPFRSFNSNFHNNRNKETFQQHKMSCIITITFWHLCGHTTSKTEHETGTVLGAQFRCPTLNNRGASSFLGSVLNAISRRRCRLSNTVYDYTHDQCPDQCPACTILPNRYMGGALARRRFRYRQLRTEQVQVEAQRAAEVNADRAMEPLEQANWLVDMFHDMFYAADIWPEELSDADVNRLHALYAEQERELLDLEEMRRRAIRAEEEMELVRLRAVEDWLRLQEVSRAEQKGRGVPLRRQSLAYYPRPGPTDDRLLAKSDLDEDDICPVCQEHHEVRGDGLDIPDEVDDVRELPCGHKFHYFCITEWLNTGSNSCPYCRHGYWLVRPFILGRLF
ncbi:uncharacterized protein LY89DRAFT_785292 [Mollisia scopiformis]|uniref:RING-type E3 ubiquitin transferase n=1 Tax=Mollisia scopiformis TaxID=149040 RepID=A0A194WXI9_MOLSC|nr:uncharacterized protein LY89DRAFT_785292 [Mollisia scopiformis]KUJ12698.1 hypothetical protein LY89DRAFT_785292 [Mollisia scopiformis]